MKVITALVGIFVLVLAIFAGLWMNGVMEAALQPDPTASWCTYTAPVETPFPILPITIGLILIIIGLAGVIWYLRQPDKPKLNPCPHYFNDGKCHMLKEQGENCIGYDKCMTLRKW